MLNRHISKTIRLSPADKIRLDSIQRYCNERPHFGPFERTRGRVTHTAIICGLIDEYFQNFVKGGDLVDQAEIFR